MTSDAVLMFQWMEVIRKAVTALELCRCNTEMKLLGVQSTGYFTSHFVRSLAFPSVGLCCLLRKLSKEI